MVHVARGGFRRGGRACRAAALSRPRARRCAAAVLADPCCVLTPLRAGGGRVGGVHRGGEQGGRQRAALRPARAVAPQGRRRARAARLRAAVHERGGGGAGERAVGGRVGRRLRAARARPRRRFARRRAARSARRRGQGRRRRRRRHLRLGRRVDRRRGAGPAVRARVLLPAASHIRVMRLTRPCARAASPSPSPHTSRRSATTFLQGEWPAARCTRRRGRADARGRRRFEWLEGLVERAPDDSPAKVPRGK